MKHKFACKKLTMGTDKFAMHRVHPNTHLCQQEVPDRAAPSKPYKINLFSCVKSCANDPSAGSPTETLLRLLLPLSDKVH